MIRQGLCRGQIQFRNSDAVARENGPENYEQEALQNSPLNVADKIDEVVNADVLVLFDTNGVIRSVERCEKSE